jgi:hypothetical protein
MDTRSKVKIGFFEATRFSCPLCGKELSTSPVGFQTVELRLFEHVWFAHMCPSRCWCGFDANSFSFRYDAMRKHVEDEGGVEAHWLVCCLEGKVTT